MKTYHVESTSAFRDHGIKHRPVAWRVVDGQGGLPVAELDFFEEQHALDFCAALNFGADLRNLDRNRADVPETVFTIGK